MNPLDCTECKWFYARTVNGFTDYMCTWRRFNALAKNRYGEEHVLTPGRIIQISKLRKCPKDTANKAT